ncbi:multiple epidermal growth factor-like domains protein 10 [Patella vulgata]|uniref:multiple epidermal growth factor-like domains protein 10 n=1 Tax=Patella vulgata TaxID=6465 RepID=UPI00218058F5|nr:multiple epidermal growth factor-like domains protein 10 [Patella vulgata]
MINQCLFIILVVTFLHSIHSQRECPGSNFGTGCRLECHCKDKASCNEIQGTCPNQCAAGWSGPVCQRQNLGYLSQVEVRHLDDDGAEVVDEDETTCISSPKPNRTGWLKVDLGSSHRIYSMKLIAGPGISIQNWKIHVTDYNHDDLFWGIPCTTLKTESSWADFTCDHPEYGRYVSIFSYGRPVDVCEFQIYACSNYTYGDTNCHGRCSCYDENEICHSLYGTCKSGCVAGLTGPGCKQACVMSYGSNCVHSCGHCYERRACDKVTGACPSGCEPGWNGVKCDEECPTASYGFLCRATCGHCKDDATCDHVTGTCPNGCSAGWFGRTCDHVCNIGSYGEDCKFNCSNCEHGSCNRLSGICTSGCKPGWEGAFCNQACLKGSYGKNCLESCGRCETSPCDRASGMCDEKGCEPGYYGANCLHECPAGLYGSNCGYSCGHCSDGESCDPRTGTCPEDCVPGWTGVLCIEKCPYGTFGAECNMTCGVCNERETCDHKTGLCDKGCAEGFHGDLCQDISASSLKGDVSNSLLSTLGAIIGIGVILFLALLMSCIVIKWRREYAFEDYDHRAKRKLLLNAEAL